VATVAAAAQMEAAQPWLLLLPHRRGRNGADGALPLVDPWFARVAVDGTVSWPPRHGVTCLPSLPHAIAASAIPSTKYSSKHKAST
jgi:hypothetical protein